MTVRDKKEIAGSDAGKFTLTLENGKKLWISGHLSVICYESDLVRLQLKRCRLRIEGRSLTLECYAAGELCIAGDIVTLSLEDRV